MHVYQERTDEVILSSSVFTRYTALRSFFPKTLSGQCVLIGLFHFKVNRFCLTML